MSGRVAYEIRSEQIGGPEPSGDGGEPVKVNFEVPDSMVSGLDAETLRKAFTFGVVMAVLADRVVEAARGSSLLRATEHQEVSDEKVSTSPSSRLLKPMEVVAALNVSRATVYGLISRGKIKTVHILGAIRVTQEELDRLLTEGVSKDL